MYYFNPLLPKRIISVIIPNNDCNSTPLHSVKSTPTMKEALTFDDVLLEPQYSEVIPSDTLINTTLTSGLSLSLPFLSAAMDTVTESAMGIAMAQSGGVGIIHKNLSTTVQADEIEKVKRFESGVVLKPTTITPDTTLGEIKQIKENKNVSGFPVINEVGCVVGILTNRDVRFEKSMKKTAKEVMTPSEKLVTVRPGYKMSEVKKLLHEHRIERVIITTAQGQLKGLITVKDILNIHQNPDASKDKKGRLLVGAALGIFDDDRTDIVVEAGADILVIDSAHGHSKNVLTAISRIKKRNPNIFIIGGNISTGKAALALANAGADVVKVGIGPGSICTTRIVAGVGVPQITAIQNVAQSLSKYKKRIGIIADGGIRYSGDIAKAIAAGADAVMIGNLLAGTEETPGDIELYQGRAYKQYRGMGSVAAMRYGSSERYFQENVKTEKFVPEGIEGRTPFKGKVTDVLYQLSGGLRSAMGYVGAPNLNTLKQSKFIRISNAGMKESHVHDIEITREPPNYQI